MCVASCSSGDTAGQAQVAATAEPSVEPTASPTPTAVPTSQPLATPTSQPPAAPTVPPVAVEEPLFEIEGALSFTTGELNAMIRFVQQEAGRDFLYPPRIEVRTNAAGIALDQDPDTDADRARAREDFALRLRRYQALGITDRSVAEVSDLWFQGFESGTFVAGVFDSELDVLLLPEQTASYVIVHELTHALDHQHADLQYRMDLWDEAELTGNFEPALSFGFVIEGRATDVQYAWMREHPDELPPSVENAAPVDIPYVIGLGFQLPYVQGQRYIDQRGGAAQTWDLLQNPPQTTAELFLPDDPTEPSVAVAFPAADGEILEQRTFGVLDMVLWQVDGISPVSAAQLWAGGASTMWGDDTTTCLRVALAGDDPADADRMAGVYGAWARQGESRTTTVEGEQLVITSCAPYVP